MGEREREGDRREREKERDLFFLSREKKENLQFSD